MVIASAYDTKPSQLRCCPNCNHYNKFYWVAEMNGEIADKEVAKRLFSAGIRSLIYLYNIVKPIFILLAFMVFITSTSELYSLIQFGHPTTSNGAGGKDMSTAKLTVTFIISAGIVLSYLKNRKHYLQNINELSTSDFPLKHLYRLVRGETKFLRCKNCGSLHEESTVVDFYPYLTTEAGVGLKPFRSESLFLNLHENLLFYLKNKHRFGNVPVKIRRLVRSVNYAEIDKKYDKSWFFSLVENEQFLSEIRGSVTLPPFVYATEMMWLLIYEHAIDEDYRRLIIRYKTIHHFKLEARCSGRAINSDEDLEVCLLGE